METTGSADPWELVSERLNENFSEEWRKLSRFGYELLQDAGLDVNADTTDSIGIAWHGFTGTVTDLVIAAADDFRIDHHDVLPQLIATMNDSTATFEAFKLETAQRLSEELPHEQSARLFRLNRHVTDFYAAYLHPITLLLERVQQMEPSLPISEIQVGLQDEQERKGKGRADAADTSGVDVQIGEVSGVPMNAHVLYAVQSLSASIGSARENLRPSIRSARAYLDQLRSTDQALPVGGYQLAASGVGVCNLLEGYGKDLQRIAPSLDSERLSEGVQEILRELGELLLTFMENLVKPILDAGRINCWPLLRAQHQRSARAWCTVFDIAEQTFLEAEDLMSKVNVCLQLLGEDTVDIPEWPQLTRPGEFTASALDETTDESEGDEEQSPGSGEPGAECAGNPNLNTSITSDDGEAEEICGDNRDELTRMKPGAQVELTLLCDGTGPRRLIVGPHHKALVERWRKDDGKVLHDVCFAPKKRGRDRLPRFLKGRPKREPDAYVLLPNATRLFKDDWTAFIVQELKLAVPSIHVSLDPPGETTKPHAPAARRRH